LTAVAFTRISTSSRPGRGTGASPICNCSMPPHWRQINARMLAAPQLGSPAGPDDGGRRLAKARRSLHLRNFTHFGSLGPEFAAV
jgi:hypothetical protein